ncbi:hypothetical protein ACHAWT_006832 [Skeletonema menzelii]
MIRLCNKLLSLSMQSVLLALLLLIGRFVAPQESPSPNNASSTDLVNSTSSSLTTGSISSHKGFRHYFRHEYELLTSQAIILGDYHPNDEESRLKLQLKALQIELAYTRNLRQIMADNANNNATSCNVSEYKGDGKQRKRRTPRSILKKIKKKLYRRVASLSKRGIPVKLQVHHGYDFDWINENGSFGLYDELDCFAHALIQKKRNTMMTIGTTSGRNSKMPRFIHTLSQPVQTDFIIHHTQMEKVEEGEMIYNGYKNAAFFQEGESFKRFLSLLSKEAACDVLEWSFMQDLTNDGNAVLALDLDGGALFNDGSPHQNMQYKDKWSLNKYASRDIRKGEEITEIYDEFSKTEIDL